MFAAHVDFEVPMHWTVDDVLSPDECSALIDRIDASEPEVATVNLPGGPRVDTSIRNNERIIFDDADLAALLYERVKSTLPPRVMGMSPVGANERFRCYRYKPGHVFRAHLDGSFVRNEHERSLLTFMVYLNAVERGGETAFLDIDTRVIPKPGRALLFQHRLLHEGSLVEAGIKYVLRSDIMFRSDSA